MNDIHKIYSNSIGIAFYWKNTPRTKDAKIQLVFKDIGFLISVSELQEFLKQGQATFQSQCYHQCHRKDCRSILLRTILPNVDLVVSQNELEEFLDLLEQTIVKTTLQDWVQNLCLN